VNNNNNSDLKFYSQFVLGHLRLTMAIFSLVSNTTSPDIILEYLTNANSASLPVDGEEAYDVADYIQSSNRDIFVRYFDNVTSHGQIFLFKMLLPYLLNFATDDHEIIESCKEPLRILYDKKFYRDYNNNYLNMIDLNKPGYKDSTEYFIFHTVQNCFIENQ